MTFPRGFADRFGTIDRSDGGVNSVLARAAIGAADGQRAAAAGVRGGGVPAPGRHRLGGRFGRLGAQGGHPHPDHAPSAVARRPIAAGVGSAARLHRPGFRFKKRLEKHVFRASNEVPSLDAQGWPRLAAGHRWRCGFRRPDDRVQGPNWTRIICPTIWRSFESSGVEGELLIKIA